MFSDELKDYTLRAHQGLEKRLIGQIKNISSKDDYVDLLTLMYGYYFPIQKKIAPFLLSSSGVTRFHDAGSILSDIAHFTGEKPDNLLLCDNLPDIDSRASATGCLYVTEGSTLGGQIITQMITRKLGLSNTDGFSFFNGYGSETTTMWGEFRNSLNKDFADSEREEIKTSAIAAFTTFNDWINLYAAATNQ